MSVRAAAKPAVTAGLLVAALASALHPAPTRAQAAGPTGGASAAGSAGAGPARAGSVAAAVRPGASSPPAASAAASAAKPVAPGKQRQLDRVLGLQQTAVEAAARGLVEQSLSGVVQGGRQLLQTQVAPERRETTARAMDAEVRKYRDEVTPLVVANARRLATPVIGPLLEAQFSEDELRRLANWLDSPLNRKYQALVPQMQERFLQQLLSESRGEMQPRLSALGERLAGIVGGPPAGASGPSGASSPRR